MAMTFATITILLPNYILLNKKYPNDYAIHKNLSANTESNEVHNCGFGCISRITDARGKKTYFNQKFYALVYCIEGNSTYIDKTTGKNA